MQDWKIGVEKHLFIFTRWFLTYGIEKRLMEMMIDFKKLRVLALNEGVKDNKVSIGMWAKFKGYQKTRKSIDNNKIWLYWLPD